VSAERGSLAPHESTVIHVSMDARRFYGKKTQSFWVQFGPKYIATVVLSVSANARPDIVCNPGLALFQSVPCGETPSQTVDIDYAGQLDWQVTKVTTPEGAPFAATVKETCRRPGEVGYQVTVTLKSDAPVGTQRWELLLQTNDPSSPSLPVLVEATIQAPLSVVPNPVALGTLKAGEEVSRRVLVRGSKAFRIVSVEMEDSDVTVDFPGTPALVQVVTVKWKPVAAGDLKREIKIKTDLQTTPMIVAVDGVVVP
jgi:hypothetical protein